MEVLVFLDDIQEADQVALWRRPLTVPQIAALVNVPERTLRRWVTEGAIPSRRLGGKWEVPRAVVEVLKVRFSLN